MKKIYAILILILTAFIMSGCGKTNISGTYVSERDSNEYLEFTGESRVEYHFDGDSMVGSFRVADNLVLISFDNNESVILEAKNDKTLYNGLNAFVKKGFWEKHWWKFVIGFVALGAVSTIYKMVTGRDLEDDLDKLDERFDD